MYLIEIHDLTIYIEGISNLCVSRKTCIWVKVLILRYHVKRYMVIVSNSVKLFFLVVCSHTNSEGVSKILVD